METQRLLSVPTGRTRSVQHVPANRHIRGTEGRGLRESREKPAPRGVPSRAVWLVTAGLEPVVKSHSCGPLSTIAGGMPQRRTSSVARAAFVTRACAWGSAHLPPVFQAERGDSQGDSRGWLAGANTVGRRARVPSPLRLCLDLPGTRAARSSSVPRVPGSRRDPHGYGTIPGVADGRSPARPTNAAQPC
jgi:hypothetical protein